ncbi:xanthine dehydrogenase molybdenum-binding subunit [Anaerolineae bacterium]|nr:xanthine dehydrogenase molybdenum-binding subunit [Anaerolineae bacterium]
MTQLGDSITRVDARAKVTGDAAYPGDVNLPGQLWMKVLFARRPHARIKRLDLSKAQAAPGVVYIFTASDVPVNDFGLGSKDAPVLVADEVRWVGEKIALVVAETEAQAEHARDLIVVEYEDLPPMIDPHEAIKPGAAQVHPAYAGNVMKHIPIRKGDVAQGFAQADVIVEGEYHTPAQEHAYLQPEAGIAYTDDEGRVTVVVAGQWTHEDQEQIAHALGLPLNKVRVIYPAIGGAFGGREDMSVQIILALAALKLNRPVKTIWSREESIIGHHKRHPMWLKSKWGATREGKIVAAEVEIIADAGPYMYTSPKVLGNAAFGAVGPYEVPNVKVDAYAVTTNNIVTGAFRGFGGPQAHFQAESQMNKLAEKLGMDPVELRLKNVLREGALLSTQTPLPGGPVSLPHVVQRCAEEFGWQVRGQGDKETRRQGEGLATRHSPLTTGFGFACALKNIGFSFGYQENAWAKVELHGTAEIEKVIVYHAAAEVGQGTHTVLAQMAAITLGVPIEKIEMRVSDTATSESAGSVSASRMTYMGGNAIKGACEFAQKKWGDEERPAIAEYKYLAPPTTNYDPETGESKPNVAYGYVAEAVEVEVDTETGQVRVVRVTCVDDVGKAINPRLVEGQIEGAIAQAQGWTIQENFQSKNGNVLTPSLSTYLIPGILDVPDQVNSVILEYPDDNGPWGVRGMAEMPFIPLAPAIIAAVHDATGVWFDEFPLTPCRVIEGLKKK